MFPHVSIGEGFYDQAVAVAMGIDRVGYALRDFHEPLAKSILEVLIPSIRQNFAAEGRPPWQELAIGTVDNRGSSHPILNVTGRLESVATSMGVWKIGKDEASVVGIESMVKYAPFHQSGTMNMPQREFMSIQSEDMDRIERIFSEWLDNKIVVEGGFR